MVESSGTALPTVGQGGLVPATRVPPVGVAPTLVSLGTPSPSAGDKTGGPLPLAAPSVVPKASLAPQIHGCVAVLSWAMGAYLLLLAH